MLIMRNKVKCYFLKGKTLFLFILNINVAFCDQFSLFGGYQTVAAKDRAEVNGWTTDKKTFNLWAGRNSSGSVLFLFPHLTI